MLAFHIPSTLSLIFADGDFCFMQSRGESKAKHRIRDDCKIVKRKLIREVMRLSLKITYRQCDLSEGSENSALMNDSFAAI